ncbi:MAG: hypothetical protein ACKVS9_20180, partial [Phycisphaerae bacterium]
MRWIDAFMHLLLQAQAARRDARTRFLMAQAEILRRKLGGSRIIPSPADRRLLPGGTEFDHDIDGVLGSATTNACSRWTA